MEVFGLVVFTIIYFVLFEWAFNSNYKMYTFGGVEGRARAHLDNALWFFIFAVGAAAFTVYILREIVTSEIFWFIVGGAVLLWIFGSSDKKAALLKELENDPDHWKKYTLTYQKGKDGKTPVDVFFFKRDSIWCSDTSGNCNADFIMFSKPDKDKDKIDYAIYRRFESDVDRKEYYFVAVPEEDKFKFYDHKLAELNEGTIFDHFKKWYTGKKSPEGRLYDCAISDSLNIDTPKGEWDFVFKRIKEWAKDGTSTME